MVFIPVNFLWKLNSLMIKLLPRITIIFLTYKRQNFSYFLLTLTPNSVKLSSPFRQYHPIFVRLDRSDKTIELIPYIIPTTSDIG